jgi:hypothetical protein
MEAGRGDQVNHCASGVEPIDIEPWAAVVTYWCEGISGYRRIVYSRQPEQYVQLMAEDLAKGMQLLVEHYAEDVNVADLDLLHESFGTGPYPEDGWSWWDVYDLLKRLPAIAVAEYRESGSPATESSFWYTQLIEFLNETFPSDDGVWMNFERPLAGRGVVQSNGFLSALLDFEVSGVKEVSHLSDLDANWIGRLAVLSRQVWEPSIPREQWQALDRLVEAFNDRYSEIYSLD